MVLCINSARVLVQNAPVSKRYKGGVLILIVLPRSAPERIFCDMSELCNKWSVIHIYKRCRARLLKSSARVCAVGKV